MEQKIKKGLFLCKDTNTWIAEAKLRPIPKMLFSEFWFEGELCILFADTNLGKSILGVQIADRISKGVAIPCFKLQAAAQPVLYFDFELSDKQLEARYSNDYQNHYQFSNGFIRAEMSLDSELPKGYKTFSEYVIDSIEREIVNHSSRVIIIDNLTYLADDNERAKDALPLMKELSSLKKNYDLSMLVLAHTPKRDIARPITKNDIQGSKMLINFCDSAFAIGESFTGLNIRYLKQIKQRNCESLYGTPNVCDCTINKGEDQNFLQFQFMGFSSEYDHLKDFNIISREARISEAISLKQEGLTNVSIAKKLCVSEGAVRKWFKEAG